jgi:GDPmannose 4,6-dehydratase
MIISLSKALLDSPISNSTSVGKEVIGVDKNFFRPTDVELLIGDSSKALDKLGWKTEFSLNDIVEDMMEYDLKNCKKIFK